MPELEKVIEDKLIEQLVFGESQWTYREDLKTEEELWQNFRYILEQNNKARLDGQPLSDAEFEQVKNQLQFSSFYKAGEWLVGENGKASRIWLFWMLCYRIWTALCWQRQSENRTRSLFFF